MAALILAEGFDKYGPPGTLNVTTFMNGEWVIDLIPQSLVASLNSYGGAAMRSYHIGSPMSRPLGVSLSRVAGSFRYRITDDAFSIIMYNGSTAVFSIVMFTNSPGNAVILRTGDFNSTSNVAFSGSITGASVHVISFDITIGPTAPYAVYLDGVLLLSGTGDTANGQSSLNRFMFRGAFLQGGEIDDIILMNPTDPDYDSSFVISNVVVETSFVNGEVQSDFVNDSYTIPATGVAANGVFQTINAIDAPGANQLFLIQIRPAANCLLNSISTMASIASATAAHAGVLYTDVLGAPNTLLATGQEIVGTSVGGIVTSSLPVPQILTADTAYWIGFITNTSIILYLYDAATNLGRVKANTYLSGAPNPAGSMTANREIWYIYGNARIIDSTTWAALALNPYNLDSHNSNNVIGSKDAYTFQPLRTNPITIYGTTVKAFLAKADTSRRVVNFTMESGASVDTGANQALITTPIWYRMGSDADPATGVRWTRNGLNAAKTGLIIQG